MRRLLPLLFLALAAAASSQTKPTIDVDGTVLHLGNPQDAVLTELAKHFDLQRTREAPREQWLASRKSRPKEPVVAVTFANRRLAGVLRHWSPVDQALGVPLAKAIHGVLDRFVREGNRQCLLNAFTNHSPRLEQRTVVVSCSGKRVEISVYGVPEGEVSDVVEVLGEP